MSRVSADCRYERLVLHKCPAREFSPVEVIDGSAGPDTGEHGRMNPVEFRLQLLGGVAPLAELRRCGFSVRDVREGNCGRVDSSDPARLVRRGIREC